MLPRRDSTSAASERLLGLHDFAAFCRHRDGATTIRELQRLDVTADGDRVSVLVSAENYADIRLRLTRAGLASSAEVDAASLAQLAEHARRKVADHIIHVVKEAALTVLAEELHGVLKVIRVLVGVHHDLGGLDCGRTGGSFLGCGDRAAAAQRG